MRQANPKVFSYSQRIDKKTNPILTLDEMDKFKDKIKELLRQSQQFASIGQQEGARKAWELAKVLSKKYMDHFPYSYAWGLARGLFMDAKGNLRGGKVRRNPALKEGIKATWLAENINISKEDFELLYRNRVRSTEKLKLVAEEGAKLTPVMTYAEFMEGLHTGSPWALGLIESAERAKKSTTPVVPPIPTTPVVSPISTTLVVSTRPKIPFLVSPTSVTPVFNDGVLLDLPEHEFFQKCEFFMAQEHIFPWEAAEFPSKALKSCMQKVAGATQAEVDDLKKLFTQISPTFSTLEGRIKDLLVNKSIKQLSILDKDFLNAHVKLVNKIKKELMTGNVTLK